jgi:hypothetical protein
MDSRVRVLKRGRKTTKDLPVARLKRRTKAIAKSSAGEGWIAELDIRRLSRRTGCVCSNNDRQGAQLPAEMDFISSRKHGGYDGSYANGTEEHLAKPS